MNRRPWRPAFNPVRLGQYNQPTTCAPDQPLVVGGLTTCPHGPRRLPEPPRYFCGKFCKPHPKSASGVAGSFLFVDSFEQDLECDTLPKCLEFHFCPTVSSPLWLVAEQCGPVITGPIPTSRMQWLCSWPRTFPPPIPITSLTAQDLTPVHHDTRCGGCRSSQAGSDRLFNDLYFD